MKKEFQKGFLATGFSEFYTVGQILFKLYPRLNWFQMYLTIYFQNLTKLYEKFQQKRN